MDVSIEYPHGNVLQGRGGELRESPGGRLNLGMSICVGTTCLAGPCVGTQFLPDSRLEGYIRVEVITIAYLDERRNQATQ